MSSSDEDMASCCNACGQSDSSETDVEVHGSLESFAEEISTYLNNSELSDIILLVGDERFYAHKFMLCKSSDVFKTMLTSSNWDESKQREVRLEETEECAASFKEFLSFLYSGKVSFSIQSVLPLLFLADKYDVIDLRDICSQYMATKVEKRSVKGAMRWLSYARKFNLKSLSEKCLEVILSQLDSVVVTEEWLSLDTDFMCEILQSSDVVVEDEFALFTAVQKWLLVPEREGELEEHIKQVIKLIRFSQIDPQKIYKIEEMDLAKKFPELVKPRIAEAYRFHALVESMRHEFRGEENMPRCYSSQHYCQPQRQITMASSLRADRHNAFFEMRIMPTDAFSRQSKPCSSHWTGIYQVTNASIMMRIHPSEEHYEKRYKVYVLAKGRDGSNLGVYRRTGIVERARGPRVQLYHNGEYMGHGSPRSMRRINARAAMMMAHSEDGWDGPPMGMLKAMGMAVLQTEPLPRHKQYPYGGMDSLKNDTRPVSLPSTQPVTIDIRNVDPRTQFTISIGALIIS